MSQHKCDTSDVIAQCYVSLSEGKKTVSSTYYAEATIDVMCR